jgi:hypothetical protein
VDRKCRRYTWFPRVPIITEGHGAQVAVGLISEVQGKRHMQHDAANDLRGMLASRTVKGRPDGSAFRLLTNWTPRIQCLVASRVPKSRLPRSEGPCR